MATLNAHVADADDDVDDGSVGVDVDVVVMFLSLAIVILSMILSLAVDDLSVIISGRCIFNANSICALNNFCCKKCVPISLVKSNPHAILTTPAVNANSVSLSIRCSKTAS